MGTTAVAGSSSARADAAPAADQLAADERLVREVARAASGQASLTLDGWTTTPIDAGLNGSSLYRVSGHGRHAGGRAAWSSVVKVRRRPDWAGLDVMPGNDWRRETLAYRSGLLRGLTGSTHGLVAARCYAAEEAADALTLWLEDLGQSPARPFEAAAAGPAAYRLGVFGGAFAAPGALPSEGWLGHGGLIRMWVGLLGVSTLEDYDASPWTHPLKPLSLVGHLTETVLQRPATWAHPAVRAAFPTPVAERLLRLWRERHRLLEALRRAPPTLVHSDLQFVNLFTRPVAGPGRARAAAGDELVAIDWEFVGRAALGEDLGSLTAQVARAVASADELRRLREELLDAYLAGLAAAGWRGDPRAVRCVSALHAGLLWGNFWASGVASLVDERARARRFRGPSTPEALTAQLPMWARMTYVALDLADEARELLPLLESG